MREHMNPRFARHVALPAPNETERGRWYFQRYVEQLPTRARSRSSTDLGSSRPTESQILTKWILVVVVNNNNKRVGWLDLIQQVLVLVPYANKAEAAVGDGRRDIVAPGRARLRLSHRDPP